MKLERATFAGGCFWCMVEPFAMQEGIIEVVSGYAGGEIANPSYELVQTGTTGHVEAVQITFNPELYSYERLLDVYWRQIDPTDEFGQFADRGEIYKTVIFFHNEMQRELAMQSREKLIQSGKFSRVVTEIRPYKNFYPAETEHQNYYKKQRFHYQLYKRASGRYDFIKSHWTEQFSDMDLRKRLTDLQYKVTQENATEPPFNNAYWNHFEPGIYVDIITKEPLFSSKDKFDAGCGWPSFTKPIDYLAVSAYQDYSHGMFRTEIRSESSDAHLGHVFEDGPKPLGLRYCINSASLEFIPKTEMVAKGYGHLLYLFENDEEKKH